MDLLAYLFQFLPTLHNIPTPLKNSGEKCAGVRLPEFLNFVVGKSVPGPLTLRMMLRVVSSMNSTLT
jgi:hypothetical protein